MIAKLNFVGDIALFNIYEEKQIDPFVEIILPESDFNVGNFEFIIPNNRDKNFFDVSELYKISYEYFKSLAYNRFHLFSLANNHCLDYGEEGLQDVINAFQEKSVDFVGIGLNNFNSVSRNINGVIISFISFVKKGRWSRNNNVKLAPDSYLMKEIIQEIKNLKRKSDHVIVFPHWGTELVDVPALEDVKNARKMIDAGATSIIGHHPHIIQGVEKYKKGFIAYSLGSFIYYPRQELGFVKSHSNKRNYSICLNLELSKREINNLEIVFYELDYFLPKKVKGNNKIKPYFSEITSYIGQKKIYNQRLRKQLLKREVKSFFLRLKDNPYRTIIHYLNYIKLSHFKRLIS